MLLNISLYDSPLWRENFLTWIALCLHLEGGNRALSYGPLQSTPSLLSPPPPHPQGITGDRCITEN